MSNIQYSRQDYLEEIVNHETYYAQFVTPDIKQLVRNTFGAKVLKEAYAKDKHFNTIPIQRWDHLTYHIHTSCREKLKEAGTFWTLATRVCILKEAARQLVQEEKEHTC